MKLLVVVETLNGSRIAWAMDERGLRNIYVAEGPTFSARQVTRYRMDDGQELDIGPGEAIEIPPGHDAWVVGDEPYVGVDVTGAQTYAGGG